MRLKMTTAEDPVNYRYSGVLAHPTSFPSPYGIGDFGKGAYDFIDFLAESGQHLWQILPMVPSLPSEIPPIRDIPYLRGNRCSSARSCF